MRQASAVVYVLTYSPLKVHHPFNYLFVTGGSYVRRGKVKGSEGKNAHNYHYKHKFYKAKSSHDYGPVVEPEEVAVPVPEEVVPEEVVEPEEVDEPEDEDVVPEEEEACM